MEKNKIILKNCFIVDVNKENHITSGAIVVRDGKIAWLGHTTDIEWTEKSAKVIDLKGLTVVPGLINVHVHLCLSGEANPNLLNQSDIETTINVMDNSNKTLSGGVTTIRDCGCSNSAAIEVSKAIESKKIKGPRIVSTGRALLMTGGHGRFLGREVDGVENLRQAAREEIKAGAKALKVIATGGVLSPGTEIGAPELNYEEISAVVEEARKRGITVAAHAIGTTGIMNAIRAGVDSIEHGSYLTNDGIDLMKEKGIFHIPTLTAYHRVVENSNNSKMDSTTVQKANQAHDDNMKSFINSRQAGVKFATGTDAGTPYNPHGNIHMEMRLMEESGVSKIDILRAATIKGAELLQLEDRVGSISENKIADIIAVEGNPLENMDAIKNIKLVIKEGDIVYSTLQ
ncbi:metal-dependent hydrolase family protein [Alteribacillus iranensis]|uniref:Imidazolonepropionase n=1 Tax=Alteribacillus iranensis TaxID=930128 RepID=A0A1I2B975_9BACI|nr:amidohydrolase family protein [Alteribacillus iranensis]SFE51863.1 Imidazolonepropionase [Alteribacillus iranensis]